MQIYPPPLFGRGVSLVKKLAKPCGFNQKARVGSSWKDRPDANLL